MFKAKYEKKELIGQGAFGKAYKATSKDRKNRGVFIVKEVSGLNKREIEIAQNEIKILKEVHHDNVVKYVDDFTEPDKFLIVGILCRRRPWNLHQAAKTTFARGSSHELVQADRLRNQLCS